LLQYDYVFTLTYRTKESVILNCRGSQLFHRLFRKYTLYLENESSMARSVKCLTLHRSYSSMYRKI